jgi:RNA polymerase sigma-70 factor (ECF subfamily)
LIGGGLHHHPPYLHLKIASYMKSATQQLTDEALVAQIQQGSTQDFAEIIHRYDQALLRYAQYLVRDGDLAKDVVQESFIKAFVNLHSFSTSKKFSSWLYRIVHNQAMNLLKKERKYFTLPSDFDAPSSTDLEESFIQAELQDHAQQCLSAMPVMYSEPLALFYLEHMKYEQISDILHIPANTVATRISRAKKLLKAICQEKK